MREQDKTAYSVDDQPLFPKVLTGEHPTVGVFEIPEELMDRPQVKFVHRSFWVAANAAEAAIKARIDAFLGVLPMPINTPAGPMFVIMTIVEEPINDVVRPTILLPNGMAAPSADDRLPTHKILLCPEGSVPPETKYYNIGVAMGLAGPVSIYGE